MNKRIGIAIVFMAAAVASACGSEAAAPSSSAPSSDAPAATTPGTSGDPSSPASPSEPGPTGTTTPTGCTGKGALAGDLDWTIKSGGRDRKVYVHVPTSYDATKLTPVVLNFHGYTSNANEQATYTGMTRKADEAGFIAVHAEGIGQDRQQSWNAGACCGEAADTNVDDVALVSKIIDQLEGQLCVDDKRVFATGMSNGGFLSHRLACELSNRIAAVAPVAGVLGIPTCTPTRPVSVMHFHGTFDTLVPYDGIDDGTRKFPSVPSTRDGWAQRNGCTDKARTTFENGDVKCTTQDQCSGGVEVTLCTVDGGGHTWPGAFPIGPSKTTQSIRATDAMWEFFQKHPIK